MKIINKKNFIPIVCTIFTVLVILKIVLEAIFQHTFESVQQNILFMLMMSILATFVISQHYRLHKLPLVLVIIIQYIFLISFVMLFTWFTSFFEELAFYAYRDMFLSFTIPYIILAVLYYVNLFNEIKRANKNLEYLKEDKRNEYRKED